MVFHSTIRTRRRGSSQTKSPPHRHTPKTHLRAKRIARAFAARAPLQFVPEAVAARRAKNNVFGEKSAVHFRAPTGLALVGGCGRGKECGDCCGRLTFPVAIAVSHTRLFGCDIFAVAGVAHVGLVVPPTALRGFLAVSLALMCATRFSFAILPA